MFGQLLAMMERARMTMQKDPNLPRGERVTARRPPIPDSVYPSKKSWLLTAADATAQPSISVKRRGKMRPPKVQRKTDTRLRSTGWYTV